MNQPHSTSRPSWFLALALVFFGLNLRGAITSAAAVLPQIRADLSLDAPTAALLTSIPLLAFASISAPASAIARRFGIDRSLIVAGVALAAFTLIRPFTPVAGLLISTAFIGIAITIGNVLVPVVVRRDFAHRAGPMTSLTVGAITGGAAIVAALTVPIAHAVGWRWALASWGFTALAATAIYAFAAPRTQVAPAAASGRSWVWRRPAAWALAVYFALQSGLFYGATAWLPTILPPVVGISDQAGATAAAAFQLAGVVGALTIPMLAARGFSPRLVAVLVSAGWIPISLGLLTAPSLMYVWLLISGFAQGGSFAMVMTMLTLRALDAAGVRDLSGMVQTVGYALAALSPIVMGWFLDGGGPHTALGFMLAMAIGLTAMATIIGTRKQI